MDTSWGMCVCFKLSQDSYSNGELVNFARHSTIWNYSREDTLTEV